MDESLRRKLAAEMTHQYPVQSERPLADMWGGMNNLQRLGLFQIPVVSDAAGLLGDVQMYREQPETRGLLNYGMSAMGLLPFVPGMAKPTPEAIASVTARTRPANYIPFGSPIEGPTGARLVGYEWKWAPYEFVDAKGEDVIKRVSDWDEALPNAETGRGVVHQFHIERDGRKDIVSSESAAKLLGLVGVEQTKPLKSLVSASKTLARQKMQLAETEEALKRYLSVRGEVERLDPPPVKVRGRLPDDPEYVTPDAQVYSIGDQQRVYRPSRWRQEDPDGEMLEQWRSARLKEYGFSSSDDYKLKSMIEDLKRRIERQENKLGFKP